MNQSTPIVLISGPVGVGKTIVSGEVAELLEADGTPHTFIDFDQLRYTFPRPADDPWGNRLGLENLAAMWRNCARSGSLNLIVSYVVEDPSFINALLQIIPHGEVLTFQLSAKAETLEARLKGREIGSGLEWHVSRAHELVTSLAGERTPCDFRVSTEGRTVIEVAKEIYNRVSWRLD